VIIEGTMELENMFGGVFDGNNEGFDRELE